MEKKEIKINIQLKDQKAKPDAKGKVFKEQANFQSPAIRKMDKMTKAHSDQTGNKKEPVSKKDGATREKTESKPAPAPKEAEIAKKLAESVQTPLKKPKKNGFKLQALNHALPKNLQECHDRFFESGFKINP